MKLTFRKMTPKTALNAIKQKVEKGTIADFVTFTLDDHGNLEVKIKKLGTSTLLFTASLEPAENESVDLSWTLSQETLAFAHKPFRKDVMDYISELVSGLDATVQVES